MSEKEAVGNFYKVDEKQEMPDECPNCLYPNKKVEKMPEECPNCHYNPNKSK